MDLTRVYPGGGRVTVVETWVYVGALVGMGVFWALS